MLETESLTILKEALALLEKGFAGLPPLDLPAATKDDTAERAVLSEVAERMRDNYPYFHPLYAGQMLKPPHPVARAAYALAMWINPNNHALDGGRASSRMEMEAVAALAGMFGWNDEAGQAGHPGHHLGGHLGHLTSSGTFANLEALWIAGQLAPGKKIAASSQAHYTHQRISGVLGLSFVSVPCDRRGRMDMDALADLLRSEDIGTVVATLGTTATGSVDPLPQIMELQARHGFRVHLDAAYGGYFTLAGTLDQEARAAFDCATQADSIVIDPHKHGLQPYGCGCVLFRDASVGRFYKHDSPYTYFTSNALHLGEISLECSRAGASAVALWATQRLLPYEPGGEFARSLERCRAAALDLHVRLKADRRFLTAFPPQLDIVIWAVRAGSVAESSRLAQQVFERATTLDLHLAVARIPIRFFPDNSWPASRSGEEAEQVLCLRSVLMKPEHPDWMDRIWERLSGALDELPYL